ncbi:helix-turn-helix transcriptional regulator [Weissella confusa]|uniref:Helix-turn-helix transcriptional regulator n=1 Tax=Weissella confusa TaxID=1583 RepID=A0AAE2S839_WEICO|nr:helix-turn-helix domain-containing protein [Weissella confusa]MBJ7633155.1 helix-turn-helix transcriptional regulator [Weissella confusa]MBJ7645957.1 helix-turn-helix transcriptional regulator [Weissella confusa]TGE55288.1 XRE family transcriptional regulator [Weissella confusa]
MTLFERTKETASNRGLSIQQVAKKAGLGINSIYRWKERNPTTSNIKAVADVLGVSVDYLLGNTDKMHPISAEPEVPNDLEEVLKQVNPVMFGGAELTDDQKMLLYNMAKEMSRNNQQGGK